jgi:hypothetical protein
MFPRGFYFGRAQRVAALLLLIMLGECLWLVARAPLSSDDYRYARCGREMWERPSPIAGYFTTCGNLQGDGVFAYRAAGLPLTLQRLTLLAADHFRAPENRLYSGGTLNGSTWEARHQLSSVRYLLRLPFVLFALWLGAGLWWVSRRIFGNGGGFFALTLYVFSPAVLRFATRPNNEVLAMWGLYGLVYTAIGVAHAMQGPRRRWRPRMLLLATAMGWTAAAHLLAALAGLAVGAAFLFYVAERRRSYASQIVIYCAGGGLLVLFAAFGFRPAAFVYVFTGGAARFWFTTENVRAFLAQGVAVPWLGNARLLLNGPVLLATVFALGFYVAARRSRYFGNTAPLLVTLAIVPLYTTQTTTAPWLWALPFLFTFLGGVFADAIETPARRLVLTAGTALLLAQAVLCLTWLVA